MQVRKKNPYKKRNQCACKHVEEDCKEVKRKQCRSEVIQVGKQP